jgi:hypothetical protein
MTGRIAGHFRVQMSSPIMFPGFNQFDDFSWWVFGRSVAQWRSVGGSLYHLPTPSPADISMNIQRLESVSLEQRFGSTKVAKCSKLVPCFNLWLNELTSATGQFDDGR